MPHYSNVEYRDMLFVYGFVNGNGDAAVREYARRFPNRHHPSRYVFVNLFLRSGETGSLQPLRTRERAESRHTATVLEAAEDDPTLSTRRAVLAGS